MRIYNFLFYIIVCFAIFTSNVNAKNITQDSDSLVFASVEKEFNALMDTTNLIHYKLFKNTYSKIILVTSFPGAKYDFTEFDKIYKQAKKDLYNKINGFQSIVIPSSLPAKAISRLNESKTAFISAYKILLNAIERLFLHARERLGVYLIDYNNYMLKFNSLFNKGIIKFVQAKVKIN